MLQRKIKDNISAFSAIEYDEKIKNTIPYYEEIYKQIIDVVKCKFGCSVSWLDIGCGTGKMAGLGLEVSNRFVLLDNSADMIDIARNQINSDKVEFVLKSVNDMDYENEFDVITSVQVFHYLPVDERRAAIQKCYNALKSNGIFITFENFAPDTEMMKRIYLDRWKRYQINNGKSVEEVGRHIARYGKDYFPITIDEHKRLLSNCGFRSVELLWCSYMQVGILGVK